jgi:hypothetical protein
MPKPKQLAASQANPERTDSTFESTSYLRGLFNEFQHQVLRYRELTGELLGLEARIELCEKMLCLTRDHLALAISQTQDAMPRDWSSVLKSARFVGVRLADACAACLQEQNRMTPEELLDRLNKGLFRFRTNSPLREIHAALLRFPDIKRSGRMYLWIGSPMEKQIPMRLRGVRRIIPIEAVKTGASAPTNSQPEETVGEKGR